MASSRQIEHLERKHKENPEGLTFAPLANAYRSSGQPERAIETLMVGLEHHPDHAPARIVLGRCHLDLKDSAAAETAFTRVFDLDRENVVALKALADICEGASRFDDAALWLGHLLEADHDNREAREQLERVSYTKEIVPEGGAREDAVSHEAVQGGIKAEDEAEEVESSGAAVAEGESLVEEEDSVDEESTEAVESLIEEPYSAWEPPAIASDVTEVERVSGLEGPGGPLEDEAAAETSDWLPAESLVDEDEAIEEDLVQTSADNDFVVEFADQDLELTASETNEFQQSSDAELLQPPVEEDAGEDKSPLSDGEADPESWFSPAADDQAESVVPESGPDGTPEPLETAFDSEPDAPVETPFEESEPLPSSWEPAGEVEEEVQAVSDDSPLADSEDISEGVEESVTDIEPGSLLEDHTVEDAEPPEDEVYPEVLGSDQGEEPSVEAEPIAEPELEPAFVATETMAEVYLSQGHRLEALDVYRSLLRSTPGDVRLSEIVSALEQELESAVVPGDEAVQEADGVEEEPEASYAASATGGQTVKALFHDLLATRPAETGPPESSPAQEDGTAADTGRSVVGEPTRPAQDTLSLSAIFGEDSSPVPPALGRGSDKDEGEAEGGFSFDNFFGDEKGGSGSKRPSGSPPKGRESEEDLDQFQSWLQGLKG